MVPRIVSAKMPVVAFHIIAVEFLRILPGGTLIVHPVSQFLLADDAFTRVAVWLRYHVRTDAADKVFSICQGAPSGLDISSSFTSGAGDPCAFAEGVVRYQRASVTCLH